MRLIDADELLKELDVFSMRILGHANDLAFSIMNETKKSIIRIIEEQPTAYNVDKVVEYLKENKEDIIKYINENSKSEYSLIKVEDLKKLLEKYTREQIEIVKSGGLIE